MAMSSGNSVVSDTMQFPNSGGGGEIVHPQQQQHRQFYPDERDGFISWLRAEFAAANAIIDSLCQHLRMTGEPGEYDNVIGCIQQRRCNWNPVLHMQQYFSVAEVMYALQNVSWRRQQRFYEPPMKMGGYGGKDYRKPGGNGGRGGQRGEFGREVRNSNGDSGVELNNGVVDSERGDKMPVKEEAKLGGQVAKSEDKGVVVAEDKKDDVKPHEDSSIKSSENVQRTTSGDSEHEAEVAENKFMSDSEGTSNVHLENDSLPVQEKQSLTVTPKTFGCSEIFDGKSVNVVDGMKLYEQLVDDTEVSKLVTMVNDLRSAGRKGHLQGQTFIVSKRPMKGHGREIIQFGLPIVDVFPDDEATAGTFRDRRVEPIPGDLQDIIGRLFATDIVPVKPESCVIDIFNENDHSQPHMWPHWFGRPVSVLFLTECDMTFGRVIGVDHPGDYRGSFKLSLQPGSMLVMQGRSSDFAKHAIPSVRKQRILVTFIKPHPRKFDNQRFPPTGVMPSHPHWVPSPSRPPNHIRNPMGPPKHYGPVPTTGVLPVPPPNGVQPIFVPAPVPQPIPFPGSVALPPASGGWLAGGAPPPPRHVPPRPPPPGTGVFLPPHGSGNSSPPLPPLPPPSSSSATTAPEKDGDLEKPNGNSSASLEVRQQDCNGQPEKKKEENCES